MLDFSRSRLLELIENYRENFSKNISRELYKWRSVAHFQAHWNIEAEEFAPMLSLAFAQADKLVESRYHYPCKILRRFAELCPEDVRSLFRVLYDESRPLNMRIPAYILGMDMLLQRIERNGSASHYQTYNTASVLLWLRFPDKYSIYKHKVAKSLCEALGGKSVSRGVDAILATNELYGAVAEVLRGDDTYKSMLSSVLDKECYADNMMVTAAIDFAEYVARYRMRFEPSGSRGGLYATWDEAIVRVLGDSCEAMCSADIAERILAEGLYDTARHSPQLIVSCYIKENTLWLYREVQRGYYTLSEFGEARYRTLVGGCSYSMPVEVATIVRDAELHYATSVLNIEDEYNQIVRNYSYDNHVVECFVSRYLSTHYPAFRIAQNRGVELSAEGRVTLIVPMFYGGDVTHSANMARLYERAKESRYSVALLLYISTHSGGENISEFDAVVDCCRLVVRSLRFESSFYDFSAALDGVVESLLV